MGRSAADWEERERRRDAVEVHYAEKRAESRERHVQIVAEALHAEWEPEEPVCDGRCRVDAETAIDALLRDGVVFVRMSECDGQERADACEGAKMLCPGVGQPQVPDEVMPETFGYCPGCGAPHAYGAEEPRLERWHLAKAPVVRQQHSDETKQRIRDEYRATVAAIERMRADGTLDDIFKRVEEARRDIEGQERADQ